MKLRLFAAMIVALSAHAFAQESTLRVRLFWSHPPQTVMVTPIGGATLKRSCESCAASSIAAPLTFSGKGRPQRTLVNGRYRLQADSARGIELPYPIELQAHNNHVQVTVTMPREDYVAAVLAGEASPSDPEESLKALAVAVRTYAFQDRSRHKAEHFDVCDTTHCQDLRLAVSDAKLRHAVEATKNELLWYRGAPAMTYYHQDCGGRAADIHEVWPSRQSAPYLRAHEDAYCLRAGGLKWHSTVKKKDLVAALAVSGVHISSELISVARRSSSGRVLLLQFGNAQTSASTVRFALGRNLDWSVIRSDWYEVHDLGDEVSFTGQGSGHGVGLCQHGALQMAREGKSYREILAFYFPGTRLGISAQDIQWQKLSSERIDLWTTDPQREAKYLIRAEALRHSAEQASGLSSPRRPDIKLYPSVGVFRDATGEPGWVAAATRENTIHLQPAATLEAKHAFDPTLRHEFFHELVEANAAPNLPRWFREGLVLYLADGPVADVNEIMHIDATEAELSARTDASRTAIAYRSARLTVTRLVKRHGKEQVLSWLRSGLPADLRLR